MPRPRKTTVATTTLSSLSAVLTLMAMLAAWYLSPEPWRPQQALASTDRPKFPFGAKRREPPQTEPSGPGLLDEVAGGRYGGGQTLLPAVGGGELGSRLPRLFPDPERPSEAVDDQGFDDDLITWAPPAPPSDPTVSVGLVPPPPPTGAATGDPSWPREMGLLEAIANLRPTTSPASDDDDTWDHDAGTFAGTPRHSEPATPPFPPEPATAAPFSDLAPVEPWEYVTTDDTEPPASETTIVWQYTPAEVAATRPWFDAPAEPEPAVAAEHDADSWHSWQWQADEAPQADLPTWPAEAPAADLPTWPAEPETVMTETVPTETATAASSWSDIFDIFGQDDGPIGSPDLDVEPEPVAAVIDDDRSAPAPGDKWASTLLDRLRAVVATPAEPVEALDEFTLRFARGLRLRLTDEQVVQYLGQGVHLVAPDAETQVLLASGGGELDVHSAVGPGTRLGCDVTHADLCPAVVQGDTLHFDNSTLLDACPHLTSRATGPCAAVCVPLQRDGDVRGVVHITTLLNAALPTATVYAIEEAADQVSVRLVELRISRGTRQLKSATTGA